MELILWFVAALIFLTLGLGNLIVGRWGPALFWTIVACLIGPGGVSIFT